VLVSACLLGISCRYDKRAKTSESIVSNHDILPVPVCPEQLGGMPTPRPPAQFTGGDGRDVWKGRARVIDAQGRDVTGLFMEGARQTLKIARIVGARWAVFKDGSPSCATRVVWKDGKKVPGVGVTTALLLDNGIAVMDEEGRL
jgi:uncharacterized protein YbbK (DUF523 family)